MRHGVPFVLGLICGLWGAVVPAQDADCTAPVTQTDMSICAGEAWKQADTDLNLAYGRVREQMRQTDAALPEADRGAEVALRDAQRAWIVFRDAACNAEGFVYVGGSIRPMIVASCLERLTRVRTEDLRAMAEQN